MKHQEGTTFFEVLLSVSLLTIIVVTVAPHFISTHKAWELNDARSITVQNARIGLDKMCREITQAQEITDITEGIEIIDKLGDTVRFLRYFDAEESNYYLGYQPADEPNPIALAGPISTLQLIFYQGDGVTEATQPADVRSVEITLTVDSGTLGPYTLSSIAYREIGTSLATDSGIDLNHAVLVLGNVANELELRENVLIRGTYGSVHSNQNISLHKEVYIEDDVSACGYINFHCGSPVIDGTVTEGAEPVEIYILQSIVSDIEAYVNSIKPSINFQLCDDGMVRDNQDNIIDDDGDFFGWKWKDGHHGYWEMKGSGDGDDDDVLNGTYYVETKANIKRSVGSMVDPWTVTIISKDRIELKGTSVIQPALTCISLIAEEIKIDGHSSIGPKIINDGLILARKKIHIKGDAYIEGAVVVGDASDKKSKIEAKDDDQVTIIFNGLPMDPFPGQIEITGWY